MKRLIMATVVCVLMAAGLSQCKCSHPVGASVMYKLYVTNEYSAVRLDSIKMQNASNSFICSLQSEDGIPYYTESRDTTFFYLYAKGKLICDTCLLLHQAKTGLSIETDSTFMLKFTLRADSTLAVEQHLLTTPSQHSPVAAF